MADLELEQIKEWFDADYTSGQQNRINAADDRLFASVSQWDSGLMEDSQLSYKGEFDIIRKARREILSDLRANPVSVEFEPKANARETNADLIEGLYLSADRVNTSLESYDNACQETVDCGIGGWELYTEYESNSAGDRHQVIRRRPLYEFNNNVFPDSNAKLLDKSDALRWTVLEPYTKEGYKTLYKDLTGEETDAAPQNFAAPESSYVFPWIVGNELYYVARFYHKSKVKDKILTFTDPMGAPLKLRESDLYDRGEDGDIDLMEDLIEAGYELTAEKKIERWQVKCYIVSGEDILDSYVIAGEHIPVVPMYGDRAYIEGEEVYEGIVRRAKDPQRLRNFLLSYLGDMTSRSPREKPIFGAEQVAGYENMYNITGAENNFPYVLQHLKDPDGNDLPLGQVGVLSPPKIPEALGTLVELTRQAVEDVANPGLPKDIADADVSGRAIELLQARLDNQSQVYQDHLKHAKRYDAVVFASMASVVYDAPREVTIMLPDGTRKMEKIMDQVLDEETGELITINDLTNTEFDVYASIGPSYTSKREKTVEQLGEMAERFAANDPALQKILLLKQITLIDGASFDDLKNYARKQLIAQGIIEPETEEEEAFLEEAMNAPDQPDPNMILAQGEMLKGQAALLQQQREAQKDKADTEIDQGKLRIDAFNAETKRLEANAKRQQAGLTGALTREKITGQRVDNVLKATERFRGSVNGSRPAA